MTKIIKINKIIVMIWIAIIIFLAISFIIFSVDINVAVKKSINTCLTIIIPSLYGYMVLSSFLVKTNLYLTLSKPFRLLSKYVFRIQPELFSVFLISLFAGYPVGAKLLSELLNSERIDKKTAEEMMIYCYSSSPSFIIGAVGVQLFSSVKIGMLMFSFLFISNVIIALVIGFFKTIPQNKVVEYKIKINTEIFVLSIESGMKSISIICASIVFFAVLITVLDKIGFINVVSSYIATILSMDMTTANTIVKSFLEVSNASSLPKNCFSLIPLITGIFSFGGFCIIVQVISIIKNSFKISSFLLIRPIASLLSGLFCWIYMNSFMKDVAISVIASAKYSIRTISPIPSVFLIIMTILLLSKKSIEKNRKV